MFFQFCWKPDILTKNEMKEKKTINYVLHKEYNYITIVLFYIIFKYFHFK